MTAPDFVALLGVPAAIGTIGAFLIERIGEFHSLTPLGKKKVTLVLPYLVSYAIMAVGLWIGELVPTRGLIVETFLVASVAYAGSQGAHLLDYGKR